MTPNRDSNSASEFQAINERLTKIEKYLWPPIEPGGKPPGPTDPPPFGPMEMGKWLKAFPTGLMNSTAAPQPSKR